MKRRRSSGAEARRKTEFWAVATHLAAGSRPNAFGAGGRTPKLSAEFPRSVVGRMQAREPNDLESVHPEAMKRWP